MALGPSRGCLQMKLGVRVSACQLHVSPLMPRAAYCAFHGRRLPHAWEWQRAGSGPTADSVYELSLPSLYFCNILCRYPWGDAPPSADYTPVQNSDADPPPPDRVDGREQRRAGVGLFNRDCDLAGA